MLALLYFGIKKVYLCHEWRKIVPNSTDCWLLLKNKPCFSLANLPHLLSLLHILSRGNSIFIQHCLSECQEDLLPPFLLFPVLSKKKNPTEKKTNTFSILKDGCCWKNLDSCSQKEEKKPTPKDTVGNVLGCEKETL